MIISISGAKNSGKDTVGKIIQAFTQPFPMTVKLICEDLLDGSIDNYCGVTSSWEIKKWAYKLKQIAGILLNKDIAEIESREFKQSLLPACWNKWRLTGRLDNGDIVEWYYNTEKQAVDVGANIGIEILNISYRSITGRQFLEWLGTEAMRGGLHQDTWINALVSDLDTVIDYTFDGDGKYTVPIFGNYIITDTRFINELTAIQARKGKFVYVRNKEAEKADSNHASATEWKKWKHFDYIIDNNGTIENLAREVREMLDYFKINYNK